MTDPKIQRALISVSDKSGVTALAKGLQQVGIELFSSGGTRQHLAEAGVPSREISAYTGFPEMMDGRLKTLHPKVHGGILCRRDHEQDLAQAAEQGILPFELVIVNLYPFEKTVAQPEVTPAEAIENIDIGGPTLIRAAAKNQAFVTVLTSPDQYPEVLATIQRDGKTSLDMRQKLAVAAFGLTARYDAAITNHFSELQRDRHAPPASSPESLSLMLIRRKPLRYGENPHQAAALYTPLTDSQGLAAADSLGGKELSYNNLLDLDAAFRIARGLPTAAAVVIKHNNPCGAASADSLHVAIERAFAGDPVGAFGSVVGVNQPLDAATAEYLCTPNLFVEAIVAPSFTDEAVEILTSRPKWRKNVRLVPVAGTPQAFDLRSIDGGFLWQQSDVAPDDAAGWEVVTEVQPTAELRHELAFAWAVCRHVKSNAIVITRDHAVRGVGAGQMSRVDSVEIAIGKAAEHVVGSVLASDAFFPFDDSIHRAAEAGIKAVIQPGGSRRDPEVVAACNQHQIPMIFTAERHFRH